MRHGGYGLRAVLALGAVLYTVGAACGGGGGGGGVLLGSRFSAQLLPVQLAGTAAGYGNVALTANGDALVVGGGTDTIFRVSHSDGSVTTVATNVVPGGGGNLLSIVDPGTGVLYAGDDQGDIYRVTGMGVSTLLASPPGADAINGMVIAPTGYGDLGGSIIAATESGGIVAVDPAAPGSPSTIAAPGEIYSDLEFDGTTLFAVDITDNEVDTVTAAGVVTNGFVTGTFVAPDGIAVDAADGLLFVSDGGADVLYSAPIGGGAATQVGAFGLDNGFFPGGLAFDGVGNLLVLTGNLAGSALVLRGVGIPGYDAADFPVAIVGSTSGFGGLAFDTDGDLLGTANGTNANRVFRIPRDGSTPTTVAADLGDPAGGELLLGLTHDAATDTTYVGTSDGHVFAVNAGGTASLFATVTGEEVMGMALAPATFDAALAGHLVVSTASGALYSIDLASPTPSMFADTAFEAPDLAFAADGTLYVLDYNNGEVLTVTSGGGITTFATGLGAPDGLVVDAGQSRLLVTDVGAGMLREVSIPGAGVGNLGAFTFDSGFYRSGIAFDGLGGVLLLTGDASATVEHFTAFP